jgi:hypothetical protein
MRVGGTQVLKYIRWDQVLMSWMYIASVPGQILEPKWDGLDPAVEGFRGTDVVGERDTGGAERRSLFRGDRKGWETGGMGFVDLCFSVQHVMGVRDQVSGGVGWNLASNSG